MMMVITEHAADMVMLGGLALIMGIVALCLGRKDRGTQTAEPLGLNTTMAPPVSEEQAVAQQAVIEQER